VGAAGVAARRRRAEEAPGLERAAKISLFGHFSNSNLWYSVLIFSEYLQA
jgi:hypothetical protein